MATAETVNLGPPHPPKEESINAFRSIETDLKRTLQHLRHDYNKHELQYFEAVANLSDEQLTTFSAENLETVRVATSAYGIHLFGAVRLPETGSGYFQFRALVSGDGVKLHCIHTEAKDNADGSKSFKAIFSKDDALEWFDT